MNTGNVPCMKRAVPIKLSNVMAVTPPCTVCGDGGTEMRAGVSFQQCEGNNAVFLRPSNNIFTSPQLTEAH